MRQRIPGLLADKIVQYQYDLYSNKVTKVMYNAGQADQFYYRYDYDLDDRLAAAYSSTDGITWNTEATYSYRVTGPLKRSVIGNNLQGLDYTYTAQGWLKGINHPALSSKYDPGQDGGTGSLTPTDYFGEELYYYGGDFKKTGSGFDGTTGNSLMYNVALPSPLYNGNISAIASQSKSTGQLLLEGASLERYHYDAINRLTYSYLSLPSGKAFVDDPYHKGYTSYTYDGNGNILTLFRNNLSTTKLKTSSNLPKDVVNPAGAVDLLTYNYPSSATNNRLDDVTDAAPVVAGQNDLTTQTVGNYRYDPAGELIGDAASNISAVFWNHIGKPDSIIKASLNTTISFRYDALGNRVKKSVTVNNQNQVTTYYVRDAQGNILATYTQTGASGTPMLSEMDLYGSQRLGSWKPTTNPQGRRNYELSDHLGDVKVIFSDSLVTVGSAKVPSLVAVNNYYPFGMLQPGRAYNPDKYRFGFNGKENDNEVKGIGNEQDYGARFYDTRLARFMSTDPIAIDYPSLTAYQFASNSPIAGKDRDGLEFEPYWATTVPQKIRQYESDLYKSDPKHAAIIIRQHERNALLFVGGALTAGSGPLSETFLDAFIGYGAYKTGKAIINHDNSQATEGVNIMLTGTAYDAGGIVIGKTFKAISPLLRNVSKPLGNIFEGATLFSKQSVDNIAKYLSEFGDQPENEVMI